MKSADKAKAFDILVEEYVKSRENGQTDFNHSFVDTLNWCVKWFSDSE